MKYDARRFDVGTPEQARRIILNPITGHDGVVSHTPEWRWEHETEYLLDLMRSALPHGSCVVDYGCGIGRMSRGMIERYGCRAIGVDISPSMLTLSIGYVNSRDFVPCNPAVFDTLVDFGLGADLVLAIWTLQHCPSLDEDLWRISRVLRPGGRLFVLNALRRSVPVEAGWADDGIDVWGKLDDQFCRLTRKPVDTNVVPVPPAQWGLFSPRE